MLDIVRPVRERTATGDHFLCQEFGGAFIRRCIELCALQDKVPKEKIFFLLNAPGDRIKENLIQRSKIFREKLAKPLFTDTRDLREQNNQFVIPALDFADLAGHKERAFLDNAFSSEDAVSAVDEIAAKRPGIDALG